jgi:beta-glucanase (GH16 family)
MALTDSISASAAPSGVSVPTGDLPGWKLSYKDDFTGTALNEQLWSAYSGRPGGAPLAQWDPSHVVIKDGAMELQTYQNSKYPGLWTSGGVSMDVGQTYGKYLVRFKMDPGEGIDGIGLLWPDSPSWPPEIDFIEGLGGDRTEMMGTLHWGTPADHKLTQRFTKGGFTEWHTLGVEWMPGKVNYTMDGAT